MPLKATIVNAIVTINHPLLTDTQTIAIINFIIVKLKTNRSFYMFMYQVYPWPTIL